MTNNPHQPAPADLGKVVVLAGGRSAERTVSLKSGRCCLEALRASGVQAELVDPAAANLQDLTRFDRAFIALHGPGGEDGTIQGALEILGIPYTGSGVLGSALGMDKYRTKQIWQALGLATPEHCVVHHRHELSGVADLLGMPLFVKPLSEGSSLGTTRVDDASALEAAWEAARAFGDAVLIERCIRGAEYTVAVLGEETLPTIRIEVATDFYDFDAKYRSEGTRMIIPSGLDEKAETELGALAIRAFRAVGATGWGRVDVMADEAGRFWFLEVNTIPGMTDHSLVPAAAEAAGLDRETLVWRILLTSWRHGEDW